jgi:hypothetical protein
MGIFQGTAKLSAAAALDFAARGFSDEPAAVLPAPVFHEIHPARSRSDGRSQAFHTGNMTLSSPPNISRAPRCRVAQVASLVRFSSDFYL